MKKKLLSAAIKNAVSLSVVTALFPAVSAIAQEEKKELEASLVEEVVVTGSRIKRLDPELAVPVQVFNSDYIENSGATTIQDFLFTSNFAGPSLFNENETLRQSAGTANFDSRGFGVEYVVVMLNGRRLPGDPLGGVSATNLNLIPISAVERIEYLSTGASAIYGADAIQGVVNVITRTNFDGLNLDLRTEADVDGDGVKNTFGFSGGVAGERGWLMAAVDYQTQESVSAAGLPLIGSSISPAGVDGRSPTGLPGTYVDSGRAGKHYAAPGCPESSLRPSANGGQECAFDTASIYQAIPAQDRFNFLASGELVLTDAITSYGEFRFSRNFTEVRNGAAPVTFEVTGSESLKEIDEQLGTDLYNSDEVYLKRRFIDAGPRATDNTNTAFSSVIGTRIKFGQSHELDFSVQSVESEMNQIGVGGQLSTSRLSQATADGIFDPTKTYDPAFYEDNELAIATQRQAVGSENSFAANLSGELPITVGQSEIGYAVGAGYKDESFEDRSDPLSSVGDVAGGASSNGSGSRDNTFVYGEIALSPISDLEVTFATRYDDYSWQGAGVSAGEDNTTWMLSASYRPIDSLLLRASTGTGFKAPSLGDLFLGDSFGVLSAVDTTRCNEVKATPGATPDEIEIACSLREVNSASSGNPLLEAETSKSYSAGLVFSGIENLELAMDYYNIEVENKIDLRSVQEILDNEADYPELVTRVNGSLNHPDAEVRSYLQNLSEENGQGIDFSARYAMDIGSGVLSADLRGTYLLSHERQTSVTQPLCDDAGTTNEPEWRFNSQIGWTQQKWSVFLTGRYVGETEDIIGGRDTANKKCGPSEGSVVNSVDSYFELGLRATYDFTEGTRATLGVVNLTDEEPPYSEAAAGAWPWYNQSAFDPRGTRWYLSFTHSIE